MKFALDIERIQVRVPANTWQDAIHAVGNLLVQTGSISEEYIGDMIQAVKEFGPYIVLMPKLALAHAAPCPAVKKSDLSLVTLEHPVDFGSSNGPVSVVLCLACVDRQQHLETLTWIAKILMHEGVVDQLEQAATAEEALAVLTNRQKEYKERKVQA